jgi:hypothetical protein
VDGLDKELSIFRSLTSQIINGSWAIVRHDKTHLFEILFLCLLQLFLEKKHNVLDISAGSHAQDNGNGLAADLHVRAVR